MADATNNPDAVAFIGKIESAERQATEFADYLKKLKARLLRARKTLASKPAIASQVAALVSDLQGMKVEPSKPIVAQLIESLDGQLRTLQTHLQHGFPSELRQSCENAKVDFKGLPDGFGVGPFFVVLDIQKQSASFQYAKLPLSKDVPLSASAIVAQAGALKSALLDPPVDLMTFRLELHEAMRVAVARKDTKSPKTELRVELPAVFYEIGLIRQSPASSGKRRSAAGEFSLPRFVVELKQFIQSNQNMHSDHQFRLEPAVIENTKNPKKSVFIPRDLGCGFGEGTYYQAVVLRCE